MNLDSIRQSLADRMRYHLTRYRELCASLGRRIRSPKQDIDRFRLLFVMAHAQLRSGMDAQVSSRKSAFASYSHALTRLSPKAVLARGYSITERADDGSIIRSTSDIDVGTTARIRLHQGTLLADIIKKEPDETS
jgi:exodeoxyribonuclease VII large subunit